MSKQNSLCFPCLEKVRTKFPVFPVFPVPWPPCSPVAQWSDSRSLCFTLTFLQQLSRVQQVPVFYTHLSPVALQSAAGPCVLHSPFSSGSAECSRSLCFTLTFLQWLSRVQQVPVFYSHLSPVALRSPAGPVFYTLSPEALRSAAGPCVLHSPFSSGSLECSRFLCFTLTFLQWLCRVQQVSVFYTHLSTVALLSVAGPCVYTHLSPVALQSVTVPCVLYSTFSTCSEECSRSLFYTHLSPL